MEIRLQSEDSLQFCHVLNWKSGTFFSLPFIFQNFRHYQTLIVHYKCYLQSFNSVSFGCYFPLFHGRILSQFWFPSIFRWYGIFWCSCDFKCQAGFNWLAGKTCRSCSFYRQGSICCVSVNQDFIKAVHGMAAFININAPRVFTMLSLNLREASIINFYWHANNVWLRSTDYFYLRSLVLDS